MSKTKKPTVKKEAKQPPLPGTYEPYTPLTTQWYCKYNDCDEPVDLKDMFDHAEAHRKVIATMAKKAKRKIIEPLPSITFEEVRADGVVVNRKVR